MRGGAGLLPYQAAKALSPAGRKGGGSSEVVVRRGDDIFGSSNHPRSWEEFVGQDLVKNQLQVAIHSAQRDTARWVEHVGGKDRALELLELPDPLVGLGDSDPKPRPMPHTLFDAGQGGVGKTSLAKLCGKACGMDYTELGGRLVDDQIVNALQALGPFGILFIDEIHRLDETRSKGEVLLTYMESRRIFLDGGEVPVSPLLTIIGATTEAGRLKQPLLQRFVLRPAMTPYTDTEAAAIARQLAGKLGFGQPHMPMPTDPGFFMGVAKASNKTARFMTRIMTTVRDLANVAGDDSGDYDLEQTLGFLQIRPDGMTAQACEYLRTMYTAFSGQAGAESIANTMTAPGGLVETEELLIAKRLLAKTRSGRKLTQAGTNYAHQLAEEAA